jgi:hypothetical protein
MYVTGYTVYDKNHKKIAWYHQDDVAVMCRAQNEGSYIRVEWNGGLSLPYYDKGN